MVPGVFDNQVHDFDPGIATNGLFWTVEIDRRDLDVHPGSGEASLVIRDLDLLDYFSIPNAFLRGPSNPARVSFEVRWAKGRKKVRIRDEENRFDVKLIENSATMAWTASTLGETFESGPARESTSLLAEVGRERNGRFFPRNGGCEDSED